jgi:hypothetical protein
MKRGFFSYVAAAFNARPWGMPIPPNWLALAAVGLLGFINPGYWLIGAGLELAYLLLLASHNRFQKIVDGKALVADSATWQSKRDGLLAQLPKAARAQQEQLEQRCRLIMDSCEGQACNQQQADSLAQLSWVHLHLLASRARLHSVVMQAEAPSEQQHKINALEQQIAETDKEQLRASLQQQLQIIRVRLDNQNQAREQVALIDAELERLRQQVELVREQTALTSDASSASRTIDELGATLSETNKWLNDQRHVMSALDEVTQAPPSLAYFAPSAKSPQKPSQSA